MSGNIVIKANEIPELYKQAVIFGFVTEGVNLDSIGTAAFAGIYTNLAKRDGVNLDPEDGSQETEDKVVAEFATNPGGYARLALELYGEYLVAKAKSGGSVPESVLSILDKAVAALIDKTVNAFVADFDKALKGGLIGGSDYSKVSVKPSELTGIGNEIPSTERIDAASWCSLCQEYHS